MGSENVFVKKYYLFVEYCIISMRLRAKIQNIIQVQLKIIIVLNNIICECIVLVFDVGSFYHNNVTLY